MAIRELSEVERKRIEKNLMNGNANQNWLNMISGLYVPLLFFSLYRRLRRLKTMRHLCIKGMEYLELDAVAELSAWLSLLYAIAAFEMPTEIAMILNCGSDAILIRFFYEIVSDFESILQDYCAM